MAASRWARLNVSAGTSSRNWTAILVEAPDLPPLEVSMSEITVSISKSGPSQPPIVLFLDCHTHPSASYC